jgi:glycopeptide antibiotics resistance protein
MTNASGRHSLVPCPCFLYLVSSALHLFLNIAIGMSNRLKKILVILPVLVLTIFFLHDHYAAEYRHASVKRLCFFALTIVLLYTWMITETRYKKQGSFFQLGVQSSFYVYIFMVLTLTGYFILFREISAHDWWHRMMARVDNRHRVNFELLKVFKIYKVTDKQVLGNLVMLFPLGIYLPLMYRKLSGFFAVTFVSMMVSIAIVLLQLATSFRSTDIDDVLLNTIGACVGYIVYAIAKEVGKPADDVSQMTATLS